MAKTVYLISTKAQGGFDQSAEDACSSMSPDHTFAFVGGPYCLTLNFVFALSIMITFYTLFSSLFCILMKILKKVRVRRLFLKVPLKYRVYKPFDAPDAHFDTFVFSGAQADKIRNTQCHDCIDPRDRKNNQTE
jgi:hypothetical protein